MNVHRLLRFNVEHISIHTDNVEAAGSNIYIDDGCLALQQLTIRGQSLENNIVRRLRQDHQVSRSVERAVVTNYFVVNRFGRYT